MTVPDLRTATWRKSSYSSANSNCVEVAFTGQAVAVRDSKARDAGHLLVPTAAFDAARREVRAIHVAQ